MRPNHEIVSREEWLAARKALLTLEKEETKLRDRVRAERLALPWVKIDKAYMFDTPEGLRSLADLFDGRSQLIVYHFMYGPDWEAGCPGCSFLADHVDGMLPHLNHHDVTMIAVSRAPLEKLTAYRRRMGWKFPWVSSHGSDFNFDYHVSFTKEELASGTVLYNYRETPSAEAHDELPGLSAFFKDADGTVYHTYSDYARGGEEILTTLMVLDRAPKGRNETGTLSFVKRKDEYEAAPKTHSCCD